MKNGNDLKVLLPLSHFTRALRKPEQLKTEESARARAYVDFHTYIEKLLSPTTLSKCLICSYTCYLKLKAQLINQICCSAYPTECHLPYKNK